MANPLINTHFQVEWGGTRIGFEEVSNLKLSATILEYREGSNPENTTRKIPGSIKHHNIVLRRGVVQGDNEFFQWWNTIQMNVVERRDIVISLLNENHEPVVVWKVRNAFPAVLEWSKLHATEESIFIETLEIAHDGMSVEHI
jgi:phage tail-like protein